MPKNAVQSKTRRQEPEKSRTKKVVKNAAGIDPKLYQGGDKPRVIPKVVRINKNTARYELLLLWRSKRQPFMLQKLGFLGPRKIRDAWKEARKIYRTLLSVGDYSPRDVLIVGVAVEGAFAAFQAESRIKVSNDSKILKAAIAATHKRS